MLLVPWLGLEASSALAALATSLANLASDVGQGGKHASNGSTEPCRCACAVRSLVRSDDRCLVRRCKPATNATATAGSLNSSEPALRNPSNLCLQSSLGSTLAAIASNHQNRTRS